MLHRLELARVGTHYAAWTSDVDHPDREHAAAMAKGYAAEAAVFVTPRTSRSTVASASPGSATPTGTTSAPSRTTRMLGYQGWQRHRLADLVLEPA